jgi:hypothetical protein
VETKSTKSRLPLGLSVANRRDLPSKSMELIHPSLDKQRGRKLARLGEWADTTLGKLRVLGKRGTATREVRMPRWHPWQGKTYMRPGQQVANHGQRSLIPTGCKLSRCNTKSFEPGDYIKDDDVRYNAAASWTTIPSRTTD